MMGQTTARQQAIAAITDWQSNGKRVSVSETSVGEIFGTNVFSDGVMRERLPDKVYRALRDTIKKGVPLDPTVADAVAEAMRDWALEKGATHYTHWFLPMTGLTAEKHDSFLAPTGDGKAIA